MLKECRVDASHPVAYSAALAQIVKPRQRSAYDLIVHAGLARYLKDKQRKEIRAELHVEISDGTISNLCDRFLTYLEALHLLRTPDLRAMQKDGYPLHLDATNDRGKGGLFVGRDGWRKWVLVAGKIPSEHEDHIRPLVDKITALFGDPIATVRDLGTGMANAVAPLRERGVPDFVCHCHFAGAVGKKLFDDLYSLLRSILRQSKVRSGMRELLRELRRHRKSGSYRGRFGPGRVREDLLALVHWLLEGDGKKSPRYPFRLPHLEYFHRCLQAIQQAERWVPCPRTEAERHAIRHLGSLVTRLRRDKQFADVAGRLEKGWQAFCELRDVLRLTDAELPSGETRCQQVALPALEIERLQVIEETTKKYHEELRRRVGTQANSRPRTPDAVILKYLDCYGDHLFGHPVRRDEQGLVLSVVQRTNNDPEHFFCREKQHLRRRLGRAHLGRDLEDQPAQAALAANLRDPEYVRILCGSLDNLPAAFANLDGDALDKATPLDRENRDSDLRRRVQSLLENPDAIADIDHRNAKTAQIGSSATLV